MQTTQETTKSAPKALPLQHVTLDELAQMSAQRLAVLYNEGRAPKSVKALDGHPRGRMLAVRGLEFPLVRSLAVQPWFVWDGKSFSNGTGVNRVILGGRHNLFPFTTRIDASRVDGKPAVVLNYDLPDNPSIIRAIHDEVREVAPGVFVGPAQFKGTHVLWFALDTNTQSQPVASLS